MLRFSSQYFIGVFASRQQKINEHKKVAGDGNRTHLKPAINNIYICTFRLFPCPLVSTLPKEILQSLRFFNSVGFSDLDIDLPHGGYI